MFKENVFGSCDGFTNFSKVKEKQKYSYFQLLIFILMCTHYEISGQTSEINVAIVGGGSNFCAGDTVTLYAVASCICGAPRTINTRNVYVGGCSWNCEIAGTTTPTIQGPNIIWHSVPPAPNDCQGPSYMPSCKVVTTGGTSTYTVNWSKTHTVDAGNCVNPSPAEIRTWNYFGETTITVDDVPIPNLTSNKTKVKPGETFTLTAPNCETNGQFPDFYIYIKENCQTGSSFSYCNSNSFNRTAPNYSTTLRYSAKMERADYPYCQSEWSPEVVVEVEESPNPNPCNDPVLQQIEAMLANPGGDDYHDYSLTNTLCQPNSPGQPCTVASAWSFIKSDVSYQAPINLPDFPTLGPLALIRGAINYFFPSNSNIPIQNCSTMELPATSERIQAGINLSILQINNIACPTTPLSIVSDPIKIVVDESSKCITNYTLPGHILFPGKVRRCIYVNDCDEIQIRTTGTGFHFCGPGIVGNSMGKANKVIGKWAFNNVDQRLIYYFQQ